jgi:hypothetical protein
MTYTGLVAIGRFGKFNPLSIYSTANIFSSNISTLCWVPVFSPNLKDDEIYHAIYPKIPDKIFNMAIKFFLRQNVSYVQIDVESVG